MANNTNSNNNKNQNDDDVADDLKAKAEQKLQEILTASQLNANLRHETAAEFRKWFLKHFTNTNRNDETKDFDLTLEKFAIFFINAIRQETFQHLRTTAATTATGELNEKSLPTSNTPPAASKEQQQRHNVSKAILMTPTTTTTTSNQDFNALNTSSKCSTPIRRHGHHGNQRRSFGAVAAATSANSSFEKSRNSSGGGAGGDGSFCLADFIVSSPNVRHGGSHKKKHHNNTTTTPKSSTTKTSTTTPKSSKSTTTTTISTDKDAASLPPGQLQVASSTDATTSTATTTPKANKPKKRVVPISISKTTSLVIANAASGGGDAAAASFQDHSNNSPFGVHSRTFERDFNNLLMHTPTMEVSDLAEARLSLKRDLNEVSSALKAIANTTNTTTPTKTSQQSKAIIADVVDDFCLTNISNETLALLRLLANIYGLLLDLNFVINILNEIAFLMNLLNANVSSGNASEQLESSTLDLKALQLSSNAIYFAVAVLESQQHTLIQLDTKSLGVVLQCERLERLAPKLKANLYVAYEQKQALSLQLEQQQQQIDSSTSFKNVCFQEDSDSRKFFTTTNEFGAFKTQRDLFYMSLKLWEKHHLNPAWSFNSELTPRVREIFRQSEHAVNMAHFAKLFVSQLLISASDKTMPEELGFGNEAIDLQKFNKLAQRLVAPSNFSVDYQFPRVQAFFRDFIIESRSVCFLEQLKIVLYAELRELNDSTLEHINLNLMLTANEEEETLEHEHNEFIVEPSVLGTMLILAKFLGFVMALPYQGGAGGAGTAAAASGFGGGTGSSGGGGANGESTTQNSALIQRHQLKMRQLFNAPFDVCQLLDKALHHGRLLITLPWLVQYMAMLDAVTLQMQTYLHLLEKMFRIYTAMGNIELNDVVDDRVVTAVATYSHGAITKMSNFIKRCCLGWLFEQKPNIAMEYYNFRANLKHETDNKTLETLKVNNFKSTATTTTIEQQSLAKLETILAVACPYLAEFRVSIMPAKYAMTKYVSRSGRYRHITPSIADATTAATTTTSLKVNTNNNQNNEAMTTNDAAMPSQKILDNSLLESNFNNVAAYKKRQRRLMESFLHAQNSSMRRLIIFLTERTYKCVIKDAQYQFLLPSKAAADGRVNEITTDTNYESVYAAIQTIYRAARAEAIQQWDQAVPNMLRKRVTQGLDALLPVETTAVVKKAYAWRIESDASIKIMQWRHMNLFKHDFYCNDLEEMAEKLCKANMNRLKQSNAGGGNGIGNTSQQQQSTELKIIKSEPSLADLLEELQHWLYITSGVSNLKLTPSQCPTIATTMTNNNRCLNIDEALNDFLKRLQQSFDNILPTIYYRLVGAGFIQILQHLIALQPQAVTEKLIENFCNLCKVERMCKADEGTNANATTSTIQNTSSAKNAEDISSSNNSTGPNATTIYHALVTAAFLQTLNSKRCCFDKLGALLLKMIETKILNIDFVNDLFIVVLKQDLSQATLNEASNLLSQLANEAHKLELVSTSDDDIQKSKLFMEALAELSRDIEDF